MKSFCQGVRHAYCAKFMLNYCISNGNPIVCNNYIEIKYPKRLEYGFESKCHCDKPSKVRNIYTTVSIDHHLCLLQPHTCHVNGTQSKYGYRDKSSNQGSRIKFHDHSCLFHQSLKKLAVVQRLFQQLGTRFTGRCRLKEV